MMSTKISNTHKLEKALILFMNGIDEWDLKWVGDKNLPGMLRAIHQRKTNALYL